MARARNIKPGFFKNYDLADLGPHAQLLFAGLWCLADREGRLEDKPRFIKAEVFPYYDVDVNGELTKLERLGFVRRYSGNGVALICITKFAEHQSPHNTEKRSTLPAPPADLKKIPNEISPVEIHGGLTVNPPLHNAGNRPDSLIPDSLIPDSGLSDSLIPSPASRVAPASSAPREKKPVDDAKKAARLNAWTAYSNAYFDRYNTEPVRNAKVNAQIVQLVDRLGLIEAADVAAFYVGHQNGYYVRQMHSLDALVKDAEKLRTEWATNTRMTNTRAQQVDKTAANLDAFAPLIAAARAKETEERSNHAE